VLVTGASGFLGGALTKALVLKNQKVRILARKTSKLTHLKNLPVEIVYGSLKDKASLIQACQGIEIVYHCAALSNDWGSWDTFYQTNVLGVQNLLEAARGVGGIKRFLHISTSDVYGYPLEACDESFPITDIGLPYNRSKGLGEKTVWDYYKKTGLPVTTIRPVTIYGPRSKDIVVEIAQLLLKKQMVLINHGQSHAGLLYIDNAVEGIIQGATSPNTLGKAYNLRDESNVTWKQYVEALADGLHVPHPWLHMSAGLALDLARVFEGLYSWFHIRNRPLLTRHAVFISFRDQGYSISKAQRDFGFQSIVTFRDGIERTLNWLKSNEGHHFIYKG
jgi:nucleoside-diphosphate-sugar epimerase